MAERIWREMSYNQSKERKYKLLMHVNKKKKIVISLKIQKMKNHSNFMNKFYVQSVINKFIF